LWFDFLYKFCIKYFSFSDEMSEILLKMYIDPPVKYPLLSSDIDKMSKILSKIYIDPPVNTRYCYQILTK